MQVLELRNSRQLSLLHSCNSSNSSNSSNCSNSWNSSKSHFIEPLLINLTKFAVPWMLLGEAVVQPFNHMG